MALVQIPGTKLVRDTESMVLINKDVAGLQEYKMKRQMAATQRNELNNVKLEISSVKDDINEIKQLLSKLLEGSNG